MIMASYVSTTTFKVSGDKTPNYKKGQRITCIMTSGSCEATVVSAEVDVNNTVVTITPDSGASLNATLYRVTLGNTYSDTDNESGNLAEHEHKNPWSGKYIPAAMLSEAEKDNLQTIDIPVSGDAGKLLAVAPTFSNGYQLKTLAGTTNRITVTITDGLITLNLPQDFHTAASIQLAQLILSSLLVGTERTTPGDNAPTGTRRFYPKTTGWVDQDDAGVETAFSMDGHSHAHSAITGKDTDGHPASVIAPVTTNFDGILSSSDDTVQKALDTIDDFTLAVADLSDWPTDVSTTEVGYLNGVTGAIQTQIGAKESSDSLKLKKTITTLTDAATVTPDFSASNNFTITLGGDRTFANPTGASAGYDGIIYFVQGTGGSHEPTFEYAYRFVAAPVWSTAEGAVDAIKYWVRSADNIVCEFLKGIGLTS